MKELKKCENCRVEFKAKLSKNPLFTQRFCCVNCNVANSRRKAYRERGIKSNWAKEHPRKYNDLIMKNYYKNKDKWMSRAITYKLLMEKRVFIKKKCKLCSSPDELQIHHDKYTPTIKGIKKDVVEKKIYFLCKKCHGNKRVGKIKEQTINLNNLNN